MLLLLIDHWRLVGMTQDIVDYVVTDITVVVDSDDCVVRRIIVINLLLLIVVIVTDG